MARFLHLYDTQSFERRQLQCLVSFGVLIVANRVIIDAIAPTALYATKRA